MGEQASYQLHIDWDRDGFFCDGVQVSDPLNLIPSPVRLHGLYAYGATANSTFEVLRLATDYGTRVWQVDTGGDNGGGLRVGQNETTPTLNVIPVLPATQYSIRVWVRLISAVGNADLRLRLSDPVTDTAIDITNFTASSSWTAVTLTATTAAAQTWARIELTKRTTTDQMVFQAAGLMLVAGASAPTVFNAGDASNPYDDIWAFCEGLRFSYGTDQYTEAVAPASSLVVTVTNIDGAFSPENPPVERSKGDVQNVAPPVIDSPVTVGVEVEGEPGAWLRPGFFSRGMLARLRAAYAGTTHDLYTGILDRVRPAAGERGARRAELTFNDPVPQLNSAQYDPPLQEDVTTGATLEALFDSGVLLYPYPADFWLLGVPGASELGASTWLYENTLTDFETGETALAFAGDTTGAGNLTSAQAYIREIVYAELGGRFFWDGKAGQFRFFERTRDLMISGTPDAPGALELTEPPEYVWGDDLLNRVTVTYYPRVIGDIASTLYAMGNLPLAIAAGQSRSLTVRYQVADASNAQVAGKDMIVPVPTVDYSANASADGSGADLTDALAVTCNFNALSADLTLVNSGGATLYIQRFHLRGTPLISYRAVQTTAFDGASMLAQGEYRRTVDLPALGDALLAESYANYLVQRYKLPVGRIAAASLNANRDAATMQNVLAMQIGDHTLLYDAFLNNQSAMMVVTGMTHTISPLGTHWLRLAVEPLDRALYWILGDATLSLLGETTRLSF